MLINIINTINMAQKRNKNFVICKKTNFSVHIINALFISGYVHSYKNIGSDLIVFFIPQQANKKFSLQIQTYSHRSTSNLYCRNKDIWRAGNGLYSIVLSTSKGIITCDDAKKNSIGGSALFLVKE